MPFTENQDETAILTFFQDTLGYEYRYGPEIERDYQSPVLEDRFLPSLRKINRGQPEAAIQEAAAKLKNIDAGSLIRKNQICTGYLQNGIEVSYTEDGEEHSTIIYPIDYKNPEKNTFTIVNRWTVTDRETKRPDIVVFVNGLPLAVIGLGSLSREETASSEAFGRLQSWIQNIPSLFVCNAVCVISDAAAAKAGTITANEDRYMEWKTSGGNTKPSESGNILFEGIFRKEHFPAILKNFICFVRDEPDSKKILAAYHQYFAVKKAVVSTIKATQTDGKAGVFWHTQGSGKSLSMVFYAKCLQEALESPTVVVITDRNDLDDQLFRTFAGCSEFLRQDPEHAESRSDLKRRLKNRKRNGIIFTTMQKFADAADGPLSERRNIIVIADEAHRSQYGLGESADPKTGEIRTGTARKIRDNLPNASFIGFTGTPISLEDKITTEIFGGYIDIYDMTQAVADKATVPIRYESRAIHIHLNEEVLQRIDEEYEKIAEEAPFYLVERSKRELGRFESILGAPAAITALCGDIISHYELNRACELTGKAMIVVYSREIAMNVYWELLDLRPSWEDKLGVVMTITDQDPGEWREIAGGRNHKEEMAKRFRDDEGPLKIVIVVDMWLTGFDVPSLATMYIYKPMEGHNLMQAIARVNRVYKDKAGGLIVDYVGIAPALRQAMTDYTKRDQEQFGDPDISKTAYPVFRAKLDICRSLLHEVDYSEFTEGTDAGRAAVIRKGADYLLDPVRKEACASFIRESLALRKAVSLASSMLTREERHETAYIGAVRLLLTQLEGEGFPSLKEINDRIRGLLKQSIQSDGVVSIFSEVSSSGSLFDAGFLTGTKDRNLAAELLRQLLSDQIRVCRKTSVVKAKKFSDRFSQIMDAYRKGMITNEEVITELRKLADEITAAGGEGAALGLTPEELAFYDALTKPEAVRDFYENDELIALTRELTGRLRGNTTVDWQKKETARAEMRRQVKRLLKKYRYPGEELEEAVTTVLTQCEMWS
jgi:type I restriction enzyme R subunit